jgi:hypothetical protein
MDAPDSSHPVPWPFGGRAVPSLLGGRRSRAALLMLAFVVLAVVAYRWSPWGNPPAVVVAGTVTSGGRPVVFGTVTFLGADNLAHTVAIGPDGRYLAKYLPIGAVRIAVSSPDPLPEVRRFATAQGPEGPERSVGSARGHANAGQDGGNTAAPLPGTAIAAPAPLPPVVRPSAARPTGWFRIPGRYANPLTSGLGGQLAIGTNQLDLRVD